MPAQRRNVRTAVLVGLLVLVVAVLQFREVGRQTFEAPLRLDLDKPAPELSASNPTGHPVTLADLRGRPAIVSFWSSWCGPCRVEMPYLARFIESWNRDRPEARRLTWVAVNAGEDPADLGDILRDGRFKAALFAFDRDGSVGRRWHVSGYPTTFAIRPDGTVLAVFEGYEGTTIPRLDELLTRTEKVSKR